MERTCIGFHGLLAVAFGSRGYKKALSHFEPRRFVINQTRMHGAGCVAHEWFHAFDYYMGAKAQGILLDRGDPDLYQHTANVVAMSNLPEPESSFLELFRSLEFHYVFGEEAQKVLTERQRKTYANYEVA